MTSPNRSNYGVVTLTANTTVNAAKYVGKAINLSAAAGLTVTLPPASGSGETLDFYVVTTVTSNDYIIQVASSSDVINGVLGVATDAAGVNIPTATTSDTITMNGSTTGGVVGSYVRLRDVASGVWNVSGALVSTGVEATPFSAAV